MILLVDTINVIFEQSQGIQLKLDLNLNGFLDKVLNENIGIYFFIENMEVKKKIILDTAKFSTTNTFFINSDGMNDIKLYKMN